MGEWSLKTTYFASGNKKSQTFYLGEDITHRDNNPAIIVWNDKGEIVREEYFFNGQYHRDNGPAIITKYLNGNYDTKYWKNGEDVLNKISKTLGIITNPSSWTMYERNNFELLLFDK